MKINCISCGHSISLDAAYDDFTGLVKCYVCGALLEIKTVEGHLQSVGLPGMHRPHKKTGPSARGPEPGPAQALGA
jgi:hypothetical protein